MTDTTSGALPGLRAGSLAVRPAGPGTGFSTRNLLGATAAPRTDPWSGEDDDMPPLVETDAFPLGGNHRVSRFRRTAKDPWCG